MRDSLSIQNISKSYNDTTVFKLISFNINPGKIYNLSGSNGAGKTTLMKIVASQILDYSGEIFLGKDNIKDLDHYYFTKVSYLPPLPNLYQHLSVIENIVFFKKKIKYLDEISVGHALISDSLYFGLENTIQLYKRNLL